MFAWFSEWFWPTQQVEAAQVFGEKPLVIGLADRESADLLASRFQGNVINLLDVNESECKRAVVNHVVHQMTARETNNCLLLMRQPSSGKTLRHLRRLLDHRSVSKTWVGLIDAQEPVDIQVAAGAWNGKRIC